MRNGFHDLLRHWQTSSLWFEKMETIQQDRNRPDMLQARREYGTWLLHVINGINVRELIFVDESGFNL